MATAAGNIGAMNVRHTPSFSEEDFPVLSKSAPPGKSRMCDNVDNQDKNCCLSRSLSNEIPVMDWKSGGPRSAQRLDTEEAQRIEQIADAYLRSPQGRKFGDEGGGKIGKKVY